MSKPLEWKSMFSHKPHMRRFPARCPSPSRDLSTSPPSLSDDYDTRAMQCVYVVIMVDEKEKGGNPPPKVFNTVFDLPYESKEEHGRYVVRRLWRRAVPGCRSENDDVILNQSRTAHSPSGSRCPCRYP